MPAVSVFSGKNERGPEERAGTAGNRFSGVRIDQARSGHEIPYGLSQGR
jgi:hypothetical protein